MSRILYRLKWLVVATSFFPFKSLYVVLYNAIAWWVARQVYKDPAVGAVYIRGGCGRGEIVPGISDIDLTILLRDEETLPPNAHLNISKLAAFGRRYKELARRLPLLDGRVAIVPAARLTEQALTHIQARYSFMEMKHNGGLLRGRDYIAARVPVLPEPIRRGALFGRIEMRWLFFGLNFIAQPTTPRDRLAVNSMCYRYCCDTVRDIQNLRQDTLVFRRRGVLSRALPQLVGEDRAFAEGLIRLERKRYLPVDDNIVEKTKRFLLRQYDRFYRDAADHPFTQPLKSVEHHIDYCPDEDFTPGPDKALIEQLVEHVTEQWKGILTGIYLVPSSFFALDDRLLLLQVEPDNMPSVLQLSALHRLHGQVQSSVPRQVRLFLLLPSGAFYLDPGSTMGQNRHTVLPQLFVSDVFSLLQQPDFTLRSGSYQVQTQPALTAFSACFFWSQRLRYRQQLESRQASADKGLHLVRQWWKWLQLEVIHRGIEANEIHYPLTLPAIERGLVALGLAPPACLGRLAAAYRLGSQKGAVDLGTELTEALAYVQQIDPGGHRFCGPPPWLE